MFRNKKPGRLIFFEREGISFSGSFCLAPSRVGIPGAEAPNAQSFPSTTVTAKGCISCDGRPGSGRGVRGAFATTGHNDTAVAKKKEPAKSLGDIQISTPVTLYSSSPADAQADREHLGGRWEMSPDAASRVVLSLLWHPWLSCDLSVHVRSRCGRVDLANHQAFQLLSLKFAASSSSSP
ncbi:uncharacterized protein BDZ83DRAFT_656014 [Colletotrichum acutatum]|uniref:Uncharacterized protein n=1 Tax=Glomerella acutata TaxID=27357 RepID=A0AAD8XAD8_GLOAC|nr:uncharacterized protein BDZ83DRAFT_656014 [Colletotrichum acutatum]KAK1714560.1 hypothetical protein BDZ83DRAFT_656014 [Colletotrichum acutatum]